MFFNKHKILTEALKKNMQRQKDIFKRTTMRNNIERKTKNEEFGGSSYSKMVREKFNKLILSFDFIL